MKKIHIIIIILLIVVICFSAWVIGTYINLKFGILVSANHLYIERVSYEDGILRIEGSLSDSAYIVSRYVLKEENDVAYISVYQGFFENEIEPTPYINYSYKVPNNIDKVYLLGSKDTKRELWVRNE